MSYVRIMVDVSDLVNFASHIWPCVIYVNTQE